MIFGHNDDSLALPETRRQSHPGVLTVRGPYNKGCRQSLAARLFVSLAD
jgi:hypothetical protein